MNDNNDIVKDSNDDVSNELVYAVCKKAQCNAINARQLLTVVESVS